MNRGVTTLFLLIQALYSEAGTIQRSIQRQPIALYYMMTENLLVDPSRFSVLRVTRLYNPRLQMVLLTNVATLKHEYILTELSELRINVRLLESVSQNGSFCAQLRAAWLAAGGMNKGGGFMLLSHEVHCQVYAAAALEGHTRVLAADGDVIFLSDITKTFGSLTDQVVTICSWSVYLTLWNDLQTMKSFSLLMGTVLERPEETLRLYRPTWDPPDMSIWSDMESFNLFLAENTNISRTYLCPGFNTTSWEKSCCPSDRNWEALKSLKDVSHDICDGMEQFESHICAAAEEFSNSCATTIANNTGLPRFIWKDDGRTIIGLHFQAHCKKSVLASFVLKYFSHLEKPLSVRKLEGSPVRV